MSDNPVMEPADKFYGNQAEAEPTKPTEEAAVTNEEIQEPQPETTETPEEVKAEAETKPEESDETNEENVQYLELDGEDVSLDDVRKWQKGHLMQSDYTKKTTTLADERKAFEVDRDSTRENLTQSQTEVSEMKDMLTVLVAEDEEINWAELKDDDPDRYIELKEKADKRRAALEKVKSERNTPADDPALIESESRKLFAANPDWLDESGKATEACKEDSNLMSEWAANAGYTDEEYKSLNRAHHLTTVLKAAKYDQLQEKGRKIKETREKVPVVTKPKATVVKTQPMSRHEKYYGKTG